MEWLKREECKAVKGSEIILREGASETMGIISQGERIFRNALFTHLMSGSVVAPGAELETVWLDTRKKEQSRSSWVSFGSA